MPIRKVKGPSKPAPSPAAQPTLDPSPPTPAPFFPFARYTSIVGVHTSLLVFTALFLPRSGFSDLSSPSIARSRPRRDGMTMLTEDPLRTIAWMCVGALILQVWWASWLREWALDAIASVERKDDHGQSEAPNGEKEDEAKKSERRLKHQEMNSQNATAPAYTLGVPSWKATTESLVRKLTWIRLFAELSPRSPIERALVYPTIGTFLGCWGGVIPIGLDWDRPWQAWPLTPAWGAFGGYVLGSLWAILVTNMKNLVDLGLIATREDERNQKESKPKTKKKAASKGAN
ncbi:hypothetical protein PHLCEN_2v1730 [Hermanssonia centrifuga]|uniref:Uncharacterized protein n=1 Tax=Hermanssonia centrifuga TaxID=98765 RepID=A0A2R6RW50_9APHY|nr:hypothetical protein PHLCEN_2v1730 [Hermanssonia centrifuga]